MHKSLDELKFWPDPTTDNGVSCPCMSKNLMSPLFSLPEPKAHR